MKKVSKIWQRVMALALVLMMVLSYVPVGVVAEGTPAVIEEKTETLMTATLTATPNYAESKPVAEPIIESYTYNVTVEAYGVDVTESAEIFTVINGISITGCEYYKTGVDKEFTVTVSYNGMHFSLNSAKARDNGSVKGEAKLTYNTAHELTLGQSFDINNYAPKLDVSYGYYEAEWSFHPSNIYTSYVSDGVVKDTGNAVNFGVYKSFIDELNPLAEIEMVFNISVPKYTVTFAGAEDGKWYDAEEIVVTVTAVANTELNGDEPVNAPKVIAEGASISSWSKAEDDKTFTRTVTVKKSTVIEVGDQTLDVKIDNVKPEITDVDSYVNDKGTVVRLKYGAVDSHIVKVVVNAGDQEYTFEDLDNPSQVLLEGVAVETISAVTITSGAGKESDAYPPTGAPAVDVTKAIGIDIQIPKIGVDEGKTYIKNGTVMDIAISNVSDDENSPVYLKKENITVAFADKDDVAGEKAVEWTYSDGVYTGSFVVNDGDKNIVVTAAGENDRTAETADGRIYACDTDAPSISIDAYANNVKLDSVDPYENKALTYKVTIADNAYLDLSAIGTEASISVSYVINGEAKTATASKSAANTYEAWISVVDGQKLESISVAAKDNTGNPSRKHIEPNVTVDMQRPVITVVPSDNVTAFYTNGGKTFAKVTGSDITFTATVTDANLPVLSTEMAADGWHVNDNKWVKEFSIEVAENQTGAELEIDIPEIKDEAGWVISNSADIKEDPFITIAVPGEVEAHLVNTITMAYTADAGFARNILFDRRGASSDGTWEKPDLSLQMPAAVYENGSKLIYNGDSDLTFKVLVTDLGIGAQNKELAGSGIATVTWDVEDGIGGDYLKKNGEDFAGVANGTTLSLPVVIKAGVVNETPDAKITITVTDYLGNVTEFTSGVFSVDNKAPQVVVSYEDKGSSKNENFFNAPRIATITYTDINLGVAQYTKDGVTADATVEQVVEYTTDGHHTLSVSAKDLANNETETFESASVAPDDFYIDTQKPVVKIEQTTDATYTGTDGENNVDYYNDVVTYTIRADDEYMDAGKDDVAAWVKYEIISADGTSAEKHVDLLAQENRETTIEIRDGEALAMLQVYACDNADWTTELDTALRFVETEENSGIYQFERITAVDMTPATVSLIKTGECVRTMDGVDYYDDAVTYDLTITDRYQMNVGTVEVKVDYNGEQEDAIITLDDVICDTGDTFNYTSSFAVTDGSDIAAMTILVKDNAGNITKTINVGEDTLTSFEYKEGVNQYTGNRVVVDMTAPVVEMAVTDSIKAIYTNGDVIYLELDKPATGDSGIFASQDEQTAGITVTVNDKNIALLKTDIENGIKGSVETLNGNGEWTGSPVINMGSTLEYKESITVKADKTGAFTFKLRVFDLAGNPVNVEKIVIKAGEENNYTSADVKVENGEFGSTISVDRRRPSSVDDDNAAPVISIEPSLTAAAASNGKELYNNAFSFALTVTDGEKNEYNSGIRTVDWVIDDAVDFVVDTTVPNAQQKGTYTQDFTIPVAVNGTGESNDVKLTITAVDNVGNTTTYTREFAVDNQAPRVAVNYDNNDVRNEKYFKANRTATITVTDINFNAATTPITTQVTPTAWTQNGSTWTSTCTYATDGEYTFAIESADLAGNKTEDAAVDYEGEAAPRAFVVDKTAPVITVTYNPSSPAGKDNEGVDYYADELNATVSIREVNFNARDVDAKFNSNNSLSGFSSSGNTHTARETFGEGNKYQFSVDYTDLAGNAAVGYNSPVFSVDLTAPTIEITEGTMTNDKLNIVQEDMVLGFTINDAQSNLKNYSVKVTHLNNEFKTEEVEGADYYSITTVEERTTVRVNFANIAKEKGKDGIYTVQITAQDYAGNTVSLTPELLFSLNRFGSTFYTDDPFTQDFLVPSADGAVYQQLVGQKLIFKEINPNQVWQDGNRSQKGSVLTIVVNGTTRVLTEGVDYTVSDAQVGVGDTKWYVYTYEVDPAIFADGEGTMDGRYSLLFYSEDEAGNKNTNESNEFGMIQLGLDREYTGKVEFTLDDTTPIISTVGIESKRSYDAENQKLNIFLSDNTPVSIFVKLNGQSIDLAEAAGANNAAWLIWDDVEVCYVLNVPEQNTLFGRQNVEIKVTDAAGNIAEAEITDFTVSSNLFVRFVNSIWFWITCAVLALLILLIIVLVKRKKQKKIAA